MLRLPDPRTEGFARRDGVDLHFQVFGDGRRAILLLPTWSIVHSDFWRYQVPHLAERYSVVVFDGRGNGGSDRPLDAAAYAEPAFADDALAILDEVEVEQAAVLSASRGGCWALILAATRPERIQAAVFIAPDLPFGPSSSEQAAADERFDQPQASYEGWSKWNRHYWHQDWPGFLEFFFSKCFTEPRSAREIQHFVGMGMETTPDVIAATVDAPALTEGYAAQLAASLTCPALVIHGDGDEITPLHRGQELARLAGAELIVLPGSGHEPQCRIPVAVNRILDDFLDRHFRADAIGGG